MIEIDVSKGFDLGCFHYIFKIDKDLALNRNRYGECSHHNHLITTAPDLDSDQFLNTYIHELIEAVNISNCCDKLRHDHIINLAHGLAQIFKSLGIRFVVKDD